jgi:branched-chain amino acid transport system substrate-binding protein
LGSRFEIFKFESLDAVAEYGANKVGVYLVAFDEVVPIFIEAQNQPVLSMVKWYGTGTTALNNRLVKNTEAAMFAAKTDFINPIFGVDNNSYEFKVVDDQIQEMIGRVPRSYAEVAYDAFWVAALTENATAGTKDINSLRKTFLQITNSYTGITGNTSLLNSIDLRRLDCLFLLWQPYSSSIAYTSIHNRLLLSLLCVHIHLL